MLGPYSRSEIDFLEKKSPKIVQRQGPPPFSYLRDISHHKGLLLLPIEKGIILDLVPLDSGVWSSRQVSLK